MQSLSFADNLLAQRTRHSSDGVANGSTASSISTTSSAMEAYLEAFHKGREHIAAAMSTASATNVSNTPTMAPLQETLGMDLSERFRAHFLGSLPPQAAASWMHQPLSALALASSGMASLDTEAEDSTSETGASGTNGQASGSGRRGSGRPASASIARDANGDPILGPNGKPMVACEICGKELADPSSLYRHRKIHSGEKPHSCPFCHRRFIQRYNMRQHLKTHRFKGVSQEMIDKLEPDLREVFLNNRPTVNEQGNGMESPVGQESPETESAPSPPLSMAPHRLAFPPQFPAL
jgi:hypothetical protein